LGLHCRQKAKHVQPQNSTLQVVASSQQKTYQQVMHNLLRIFMNNLWVFCGSPVDWYGTSHIVNTPLLF